MPTRWIITTCVALLTGCASYNAVNPTFDTSVADARTELKTMRADPIERVRPLVFIGPFFDPFVAEMVAMNTYDDFFTDDNMVGISFTAFDTFESCRRKVIREVDARFPTDDPHETIEVDVLAFSMGGLVSRYAALEPDAALGEERRLKIHTLYTVSSPHRGANIAPMGLGNALAYDMRHGSDFIRRLDAGYDVSLYTIVAYTRLGDLTVGEEHTAPQGQTPIWVSNLPFQSSHSAAPLDPRITVDIARQLRGGPSSASEPRAALP